MQGNGLTTRVSIKFRICAVTHGYKITTLFQSYGVKKLDTSFLLFFYTIFYTFFYLKAAV